MLDTISNTKRTRSQLALPDLILQLPLARSPLKDARTALRNQSHQDIVLTPEPGFQRIDLDSDDEILLSPRKKIKISNTSSERPPFPCDEYAAVSGSDLGRGLKRFKRDILLSGSLDGDDDSSDVENTHHHPSHKHGFSTPTTSHPSGKTPIHSFTAVKKSVFSSAIMDETDRGAGTAIRTPRARSVLFSQAGEVLNLDLRNLPPSPWRSPSEQKRPEMRFTSAPLLDAIPDVVPEHQVENDSSKLERVTELTEGDDKDVDSETRTEAEAQSILETEPTKSNGATGMGASGIHPENVSPISPFSFSFIHHETPVIQDNFEVNPAVPSTPTALFPVSPMSPLTPLMETPCLPNYRNKLDEPLNVQFIAGKVRDDRASFRVEEVDFVFRNWTHRSETTIQCLRIVLPQQHRHLQLCCRNQRPLNPWPHPVVASFPDHPWARQHFLRLRRESCHHRIL